MDASIYESLLREANMAQQGRANSLYVNVMPSTDEIKADPLELTPDEVFALSTRGYMRDDEIEDTGAELPPAQMPGLDDGGLKWAAGPDALAPVYKDRLNSSERYDDMMIRQQKEAQAELDKNIESGMKKLELRRKAKENPTTADIVAKQMGNMF